MTHKETAGAVDQQQVEPGKKSDLDSLLDAIKAHVDRGFDRIQEQNFEDAIGYFDEAIRLDRRAARAFHGRAQSWHSLKETESALSDYDEAIRLDPKVARAFFNRGRLRLERRETGEAIADYNKLLNEMDGLRPDADVLFILTTNRPESLEMALASRPGRVDQAIEFPLPDGEGRAKLIRLYSHGLSVPQEVIAATVKKTENVSASFIKELMRRSAQFHLETATESPDITLEDVDAALEELLFAGGSLNRKLLGAEIQDEE